MTLARGNCVARVQIKKGYHAGKELVGVSFELSRGLSMGKNGAFVLVNGLGQTGFPQRNFKIFVESEGDFQITGSDAGEFEKPMASVSVSDDFEETDDAIKERLAERFEIMGRMTEAAAHGTIKGLVISGAPGTGKSYGVEAALNHDSLMDKLAFNAAHSGQDERRVASDGVTFKPRYRFIKGYVTPPALYRQLYEYNEPREILVFDDCDSILYDEISLNLLKSALDTAGKRTLFWLSNSNRGDDAPERFEFKGSVIFITNLDFEKQIARNTKLAPHLDAIMDRCLYLDLTIHSKRDKLIRIDHVCRDLRMLEKKGLDSKQVDEVIKWTHDNSDRFPRLSLRKVDQLADIRLSSPNWQREAEIMLLRRT